MSGICIVWTVCVCIGGGQKRLCWVFLAMTFDSISLGEYPSMNLGLGW